MIRDKKLPVRIVEFGIWQLWNLAEESNQFIIIHKIYFPSFSHSLHLPDEALYKKKATRDKHTETLKFWSLMLLICCRSFQRPHHVRFSFHWNIIFWLYLALLWGGRFWRTMWCQGWNQGPQDGKYTQGVLGYPLGPIFNPKKSKLRITIIDLDDCSQNTGHNIFV